MATVDIVQSMAQRSNLLLGPEEVANAVRIIDSTGSLAPSDHVAQLFLGGKLTPAELTFFLPRMWRNRPAESATPDEVWRQMFDYALYTEDMAVARRRRKSCRAYRGATAENREGLSWSTDLGQARYFAASRQAPGIVGQVWVVNIPGDRMRAKFGEGWEKEIVADVRGLNIVPWKGRRSFKA